MYFSELGSYLRRAALMQASKVFFFGLLAVLLPTAASAHEANQSYVYFIVTDTSLDGRFEARLTDIDRVVPLDQNDDGEVSREELLARGAEVFDFFAQRLVLSTGDTAFELEGTGIDFLDTDFGTFAQLQFAVPSLTDVPETLEVEYRAVLADLDPAHLGYVLIESNTRTGLTDNEAYISLVFNQGAGRQTLSLVGEPWIRVASDFVVHGVWHIWIGFDHIAFLIALLLPAAMISRNGRWAPQERLRPALIQVLKVVTTFTLAHSITLCLAALGVVTLPSTLVEAVIAISIAFAALMNLFPGLHRRWFALVVTFGLFHGFGFANVLAPLALDPSGKLVALAAFNIGVELGQIAIVLVIFPVLYLLRTWRFYPALSLRMGSVALIALAAFWFVERTFDVLGPVRSTIFSAFS